MSSPCTASIASQNAGLLKSSIESVSSLMALQVLSRAFTFILNQALFRLASPSAFGVAAIQFEFILTTILFLSREGVRCALLRVDPRLDSDTARRRMNVSFLPIIFGIPIALCTSILYLHAAGQTVKRQPHFESAISLYALAAMMELLIPLTCLSAMVNLKTSVRVRAEGLGITIKSITTFLILLYDTKFGEGNLSLLAFAFGQLLYSTTMFAKYLTYFGSRAMQPKLSSLSGSPWAHIDYEAFKLSTTMTLQSLVKHILTEGDKIIISWFSPLQDQGGYALAVNYGSLVARIVFQPVEETLRLFFSRTLNTEKKEQGSLKQAADTLYSLLSIQMAFSVLLLVFGTAYLPILLPFLLPKQYLATSAPSVLTAWVWYIPVLALNGGLEAFLSSVATPRDLNAQSRWMIVFSITYVLSAIVFYRRNLGDASLVYANIINLCARIVYCLIFIKRYFKKSPTFVRLRFRDALPSWQLWTACGFSAVLVHASEQRLKANAMALQLGRRALMGYSVLLHLVVGISLALICLATWWKTSGQKLNLPISSKTQLIYEKTS